jgi:phosphotransferase system  glucose/maltose/N-acetylglucosamine-specific IIC component
VVKEWRSINAVCVTVSRWTARYVDNDFVLMDSSVYLGRSCTGIKVVKEAKANSLSTSVSVPFTTIISSQHFNYSSQTFFGADLAEYFSYASGSPIIVFCAALMCLFVACLTTRLRKPKSSISRDKVIFHIKSPAADTSKNSRKIF